MGSEKCYRDRFPAAESTEEQQHRAPEHTGGSALEDSASGVIPIANRTRRSCTSLLWRGRGRSPRGLHTALVEEDHDTVARRPLHTHRPSATPAHSSRMDYRSPSVRACAAVASRAMGRDCSESKCGMDAAVARKAPAAEQPWPTRYLAYSCRHPVRGSVAPVLGCGCGAGSARRRRPPRRQPGSRSSRRRNMHVTCPEDLHSTVYAKPVARRGRMHSE
jgi:hypothetical protein